MQKINVVRVCAATFVAFAVCLAAYAEDGYIESEGEIRRWKSISS